MASSARPATSSAAVRTRRAVIRKSPPTLVKQIDPALRRAMAADGGGAQPLTVMVKLDTQRSAFGKLPVTNRSGSARERTFNQEVAKLVNDVAASGNYKILSTAANLGVATLEASTSAVKGLLQSSKITGAKLKVG